MRDYQAEALANATNQLMEKCREVGGFVGVIELALMDFRHDQRKKGVARLQKAIDEYNTKRDAELIRLGLRAPPQADPVASKPIPTMVSEPDYDDKHSDAIPDDGLSDGGERYTEDELR